MKALFRPWIVEKDVRFNVRCEEMKFSAQSYIFEPVYDDYADTPTDYTNCGQD